MFIRYEYVVCCHGFLVSAGVETNFQIVDMNSLFPSFALNIFSSFFFVYIRNKPRAISNKVSYKYQVEHHSERCNSPLVK